MLPVPSRSNLSTGVIAGIAGGGAILLALLLMMSFLLYRRSRRPKVISIEGVYCLCFFFVWNMILTFGPV